MLEENTIVKGAAIKLDVRSARLWVAKGIDNSLVSGINPVCVHGYDLNDMDTALDFFEYINSHKSRFSHVVIV